MTLSNPIKTIAKSVSLCAIILALIAVGQAGQAGQFIISANELRDHTLKRWQHTHPEQSELIEHFVSLCINRAQNPPTESIEFVSVYDCGNELGAQELMKELQKSGNNLNTMAWPLSLFD